MRLRHFVVVANHLVERIFGRDPPLNGLRSRHAMRCVLLYGVSQLMRQKLASGRGAGRVLPRTKDEMIASRVRMGPDCPSGFRRSLVRMHPNLTEIQPGMVV